MLNTHTQTEPPSPPSLLIQTTAEPSLNWANWASDLSDDECDGKDNNLTSHQIKDVYKAAGQLTAQSAKDLAVQYKKHTELLEYAKSIGGSVEDFNKYCSNNFQRPELLRNDDGLPILNPAQQSATPAPQDKDDSCHPPPPHQMSAPSDLGMPLFVGGLAVAVRCCCCVCRGFCSSSCSPSSCCWGFHDALHLLQHAICPAFLCFCCYGVPILLLLWIPTSLMISSLINVVSCLLLLGLYFCICYCPVLVHQFGFEIEVSRSFCCCLLRVISVGSSCLLLPYLSSCYPLLLV